MSMSPICIRDLLASRGLPNRCSCPRCREQQEYDAALEFYRRDLPATELFPEKTGKEKG